MPEALLVYSLSLIERIKEAGTFFEIKSGTVRDTRGLSVEYPTTALRVYPSISGTAFVFFGYRVPRHAHAVKSCTARILHTVVVGWTTTKLRRANTN